MKEIKKIKKGLISRQLSIAKIAIKTGKNLYNNRGRDLKGILQGGFENQIDLIVSELGLMKGSLMKAGQMLSVYGEAFLPESAQKLLAKLEKESNYLAWDEIKKSIPREWRQELTIEEIPIAAASIGQVHIAKNQIEKFAMKIQYNGVRDAIRNDIRSLKFLLSAFKIVPKEIDLDSVYLEVQKMLLQETDYIAEAENTKKFAELLKNEKDFIVPKVIEKYSNDKILTTEFLVGHNIRSLPGSLISQEQRNELGKSFLRLFFLELFKFEKVQTDVHLGNYLIMDIENDPKWGLIDFGATKSPKPEFIKKYRNLIVDLSNNNRENFLEVLFDLGYLSSKKPTNEEFLWEYAEVIATPFSSGVFDWGNSDISEKVFRSIPKLIKEVSIGNPPPESIFLDRKVGGVFFLLQNIGAIFDPKEVLQEFTHNLDT